MALQDLTPQLRTRLSRMERAVGWFVLLAAALLVFGLAYYVFKMAERKGWFVTTFTYETSLNDASGLKVGDPVKLMGFSAGQITKITPNAPDAWFGVTITFTILEPHYGYIWDDSQVRVSSDLLLGGRVLEITKGSAGVPTIREGPGREPLAMLRSDAIRAAREKVVARLSAEQPELARTNPLQFSILVMDELKRMADADPEAFYTNLAATYWIPPQESPGLNERLEKLANQIEEALPNVLNLTNQIASVLSNTATLSAKLSELAAHATPAISNLARASERLDQPGGLGEWLLPTNVVLQLEDALGRGNTILDSTHTNLDVLARNLNESLLNLASITSNPNAQVQANSNMLSVISKAVMDADSFVQGLKHHWLLRSAFKEEREEERPQRPPARLESPRERRY